MGWHRNYEDALTDLQNEKDSEIAELKAEIQHLKDIIAAHNIRQHSPELEDYKKMHPEEE